MKEPRVRGIIDNYKQGNLKGVYEYLSQPDMIVDPSTWSGKIKQMIEKEEFYSAKILIETTAYKFIKNKDNGKN